uniref:Serine/threonine-protein kinase tousled-like 2 n=1 Tax=Hymenolepis diminuta TaxID=6216 RepID=A0A158QEX1_HYMDI
LHDLVQRGMANATEGNQVRPKIKKILHENTSNGGESSSTAESPARNGGEGRRHHGGPRRDISYDDGESHSTADGATESTSNSLRSCLSGGSTSSLPFAHLQEAEYQQQLQDATTGPVSSQKPTTTGSSATKDHSSSRRGTTANSYYENAPATCIDAGTRGEGTCKGADATSSATATDQYHYGVAVGQQEQFGEPFEGGQAVGDRFAGGGQRGSKDISLDKAGIAGYKATKSKKKAKDLGRIVTENATNSGNRESIRAGQLSGEMQLAVDSSYANILPGGGGGNIAIPTSASTSQLPLEQPSTTHLPFPEPPAFPPTQKTSTPSPWGGLLPQVDSAPPLDATAVTNVATSAAAATNLTPIPQPISAQHRRQLIRPSMRPKQQQQTIQQQNFPTLKTQRMMCAAPSISIVPSESGVGSAVIVGGANGSQSDVAASVGGNEGVRLDDIYSFSAIKRLCSRHMKKLQQEQDRLKEIENAKMVELNHEYDNFITAKKKCVCRMQEQHENSLDRALKRTNEEEARFVRELEARAKEELKSKRRIEFPLGSGSNSPYNDLHTPDLNQMYKQVMNENNVRLCKWRYEKLKARYELQMKQFDERKKLENEVLKDKSCMLLSHHAQVEAIELANLRAKHALQSRHLEEKCAFFDAEQRRFEEFQFAEFEKEARHRRKVLAKELKVRTTEIYAYSNIAVLSAYIQGFFLLVSKHYEETLRPQNKVTGWFLNRKKISASSKSPIPSSQHHNQPGSPIGDKNKSPHNSPLPSSPGETKAALEEYRRQRTETLEEELTRDRAKLNERMRQLREQMHNYQDRLARDFRAQRDQEDAELRSRIKTRADKLEEAIEKNKSTVMEEHNQEERKIEIDYASLQRRLESDCQFLGVDFQAVQFCAETGLSRGVRSIESHVLFTIFRLLLSPNYFAQHPTITLNDGAKMHYQGVKFKVASSFRYNEGDPRKETLAYSKATFACVLKRTHHCPSFFRVEVRKGVLQVVERAMEHNHCRIAGDPLPVVDLTEQFDAHFKNAKLMSFNDVMAKVRAFEEATGSGFRVGRSDLFKPGEPERDQFRYRRITYECVHFGQRKSATAAGARLMHDLNGSASSRSPTARLGCMAKFDVRYSPQGFKITAVVMKHNHKVSPSSLSGFAVGKLSRRKCTQYQQRHCTEDDEIRSVSAMRTVKQLRTIHSMKRKPATEKARFSASQFAVGANNRAPQPYWMTNPATLLSKTLTSERPSKKSGEGGVEASSPELNQSERRLLLSGKMQRILEKACHGDSKRFQQCCGVMDKLEREWAREDAMEMMMLSVLRSSPCIIMASFRCTSISTTFNNVDRSTPLEILRKKNERVDVEFPHLPEAERFHRKYANFEEIVKDVPVMKCVNVDAIFANREVRLSELDVYGFDYDYTLVNYTDGLADFIFDTTIDMLVSKWKYPCELKNIKYDPNFLIRGLHYDIITGFLMKVDAYRNIQPGTVYKGLKPVPADVVQANYNGLYIPAGLVRGSVATPEHKMTQMMDFFDLPAAYAVCSVIEYFDQSGIVYQPECIYTDVKQAIEYIHGSGLLYRTICADLKSYIKPNPQLRDLLIHLASHAKSLFLISNSGADFMQVENLCTSKAYLLDANAICRKLRFILLVYRSKGMRYVVGNGWERFFDVIIVRANKPDFFRSNSAPFRAVDESGAFESWAESTKLERGHLYQGGNLNLLNKLKGWQVQRVLYFGDHVYSDLADASNQWGWATAAVIPELENELALINTQEYQRNLHRLVFLEELLIENQMCRTAVGQAILNSWRRERDQLRQESKECFNPRFGSVFRSFHNYSYFAQRLGLYASMYTSTVTNLLQLPINHICYPRRALLPHEPH